MVETRTLNQDEIEAMMARVNSVPMMHTLDLEILRLDHGECDAKVPRKIEWDGIYQTMHGGILATIADSVTCWAILTQIGAKEKVATTDFNIRFLRPCLTDALCHARVVKLGRTLCVMGRPPTDAEMDAAIERWVREEVLYREALRLGLDEGDAVVRRRLATKMDELAGAEAEVATVSDKVLEQWLAERGSNYARDGTMTFEQVYFVTEAAAQRASAQAEPEGEPISLPRTMSAAKRDDVADIFGRAFAEALREAKVRPGWHGPLASGYGWHLVRVSGRSEGRTPPLAEIREEVEADWRSATIAARRKRAYEVLREAYSVEVE